MLKVHKAYFDRNKGAEPSGSWNVPSLGRPHGAAAPFILLNHLKYTSWSSNSASAYEQEPRVDFAHFLHDAILRPCDQVFLFLHH